jgi:hypothetical protein
VKDLAWDPSGQFLAVACGDDPPVELDGEARVWDAATGDPISPTWWFDEPSTSADFDPRGERCVIAGGSGVAIYDLPRPAEPDEAIIARAQLISESHVDATGGLAPLSTSDVLGRGAILGVNRWQEINSPSAGH